ncbi:Zn-ribbon domain-containing OB-fold protein [Burkholderia sp. BCC1993]|uniref:Zn-ribbon domain-containing OB-fold protein n=1 Tax=Burkholderia sp. BCC1993 TaxID=2817444 RepID=UPI002AAFC7E5|nr:OB-fold domain-containing protein [Burkholderia sp. BCC1993]
MIPGIPLPASADPLEQPFWRGLAAGELRVQHCAACARWYFPPVRRCTHCPCDNLTWTKVSGRGRIWSFTQVHPPLLAAFAPYAPFPVVLVALEESPVLRLVGNLVRAPGDDINRVAFEQIRVGQLVEALFEPLAEGVFWPRWRLVEL